MKRVTRVICLALTIMIVLSMIPIWTFAAEYEADVIANDLQVAEDTFVTEGEMNEHAESDITEKDL